MSNRWSTISLDCSFCSPEDTTFRYLDARLEEGQFEREYRTIWLIYLHYRLDYSICLAGRCGFRLFSSSNAIPGDDNIQQSRLRDTKVAWIAIDVGGYVVLLCSKCIWHQNFAVYSAHWRHLPWVEPRFETLLCMTDSTVRCNVLCRSRCPTRTSSSTKHTRFCFQNHTEQRWI